VWHFLNQQKGENYMSKAKITLVGIIESYKKKKMLKNGQEIFELQIIEKFTKKNKGSKTWLEKNLTHKIKIFEKEKFFNIGLLLKKGAKILVSGQMNYVLKENKGKRSLESYIVPKQIQLL
jgi:single-stranded DNA-binding protein